MPQPELVTPRLRLRARRLADVEAIVAMDAAPEVRRFLGPVDADTHRADVTAQIVKRVPGHWAIEERDRPGLIGITCIIPRPDGLGNQIGWRLSPAAWGQGFAAEAAAAVLHHAAAAPPPGYGDLVALIDPANTASIAVARRLGMRPVDEGVFYGGPHVVYGLGLCTPMNSPP